MNNSNFSQPSASPTKRIDPREPPSDGGIGGRGPPIVRRDPPIVRRDPPPTGGDGMVDAAVMPGFMDFDADRLGKPRSLPGSPPVNNTPVPSYGTLPAPSGAGFYGNALQQGQENRNTALYNSMTNNPNIRGPLGNQTVTYNNGVPTVTQELPEETQRALEAQQRSDRSMSDLGETSARNARSAMANPFQFQGPGLQTSIGDYTKMPVGGGMTAQQAMLSRLEPTLAQNRQSRMQELANQGVAQGTEAYRNQMNESGQNENDLRLQAALQGLNVDLSAQQQEYGQALSNAQFGNTASNQSLERQLKLRNQPLDEYAAIRNASPLTMPNMPQFQGTNAAPAPLMDASRLQADMDINSTNRNTAKTNADKSTYTDIAKGLAGSDIGQGLISKGLGVAGNAIKGLFGGAPAAVNAALPAAVAPAAATLAAPAASGLLGGGLGQLGGAGFNSFLTTGATDAITGAAMPTLTGGGGAAGGGAAASTGGGIGMNLATLGPIGGALALAAILKAQGKYTGRASSGSGTTDPYAGMGFNDTGYGTYDMPDLQDPAVAEEFAAIDPDSGLRYEKKSGSRDTVYYNKDGSEAYRVHQPREGEAFVVEGSGVGVM